MDDEILDSCRTARIDQLAFKIYDAPPKIHSQPNDFFVNAVISDIFVMTSHHNLVMAEIICGTVLSTSGKFAYLPTGKMFKSEYPKDAAY